MWLAAKITGPVAGTLSKPFQSALVITRSSGRTTPAVPRLQNPSRCLMAPPSARPPRESCTRAGSVVYSPLIQDGGMRWPLILPVKRLPVGKSRLRPAGDALVLAIALDTIAAAAECGDVLVVTSDATVRAAASALGAAWLDDPGDLNAAIRAGEAAVGRGHPRAALLADLPALRPIELAD